MAAGDLDGEIKRLERLSIISKLSQELENHIDINDIDLAEFILHLVEESKDVNDFKNKLSENEADFSDQLIESLYRISCVLLKRVLVSGDKIQSDKNCDNIKRKSGNNDSELSHIFPVLCLPNVSKSKMDKTKISDQKIADEALDELEGLIGSENTSKKPKSEANIPPVKKDSKYDRTYKKEPSIGHIYDGIVTKVLEYGCFVRIFSEDTEKVFRDGLVHVSQISQQIFINNARDFIRTGDKIKVKVLSIIDERLKLSLKDVDQKTGQDIGDDGSESKQHSKLSNEVMYGDEEHWNDDEALRGTNFDKNLNTNQKFINDKATSISNKKFKQDDAFTRFELSQMRHGIIGKHQPYLGSKNNNFDSEKFSDGEDDDYLSSEEDYEVEIIDDTAPFMKKNTRKSILTNLLPVKVLKNPEGSLAKAAQTQVELAKERREKKQERIQQANQQNRNSNPSDSTLSAQDYIDKQAELRQKQFKSENWLDPANNSEAIDSSTGLKNSEVSIIQSNDSDKQHQLLNAEWKKYLPNIYSRKILSQSSGRTSKTILEQRQSLPIYLLRKPLMGAINENNCLIVIGETGSGKTTQITQYLVEEGYVDSKSSGVSSRIACTQPRRVAAISVAKRVAEEIGCSIGQQVGYAIRFEDKTSPETKIKYMTEGMLLRECLVDPELRQYRIIMLDEAHERTISTDVLFGLLKDALRKRTDDLKVIITSATLDAVKFSDYFLQSPIFTIPGRTFPVEIFYSKEQEVDYVEASLTTIMNIHLNEHPGDILVFLTGQEEIDTACEILHRRIQSLGSDVPELLILPVYGTLPSDMQSRIFDAAPLGSRKVVIATNIAETSLTIDGIYYVVDPGFVKQKVYNSKSGIDQLLVTPISQAQANQRSGRAGRTGPGKCFRLYTEQSYNDEMLPTQVPEIQRSNMSSTVLQLKAMGINDLLNFDFMDPPPAHSLISALEELHALGCIDDEGLLTRLGRRMAEFPLSPMLSKVLIMSVHLECSEEILTIVSMLSVENVFYRPKDKAEIADQKRSQFHCPEGDHLTLLKVFNTWQQHGCSQNWCRANFMHSRTLNQAKDVRKQMLGIMERHHLKIVSCNNDNSKIQRAIVSGYFRNAAKRDSVENGYKTCVDNQLILIHPSSAVFHRNPQWIIYNELVLTTKEYAHNVTVIDPKWLIEFAPSFYKKASLAKMNKARGTQKLNPLFDHRDPEGKEWRISRVHHKSFSKVTF